MTDITAIIGEYNKRTILIPLDEYEVANLLGALKRAQNNGDWHGQVLWKLRQGLHLLGVNRVMNNFGDDMTAEDIAEIRGT